MGSVNTDGEYAGGASREDAEASAGSGPDVVLLLPGLGSGGGGTDTERSHAGFAVQSDGTAGKLYGDLGGSIEGVTFTYVSLSCADVDRAVSWMGGKGRVRAVG